MATLVIGYGNSLRSDDGVGPRIAAAIDAWQLPGVEVIIRHQLVPELAEDLAQFDRVIFIDAVWRPKASISQPLRPQLLHAEAPALTLGHICYPQMLLVLAEQLYDHRPLAWWLQVPVASMELGEEISANAAASLEAALKAIRMMLPASSNQLLSGETNCHVFSNSRENYQY